MFMPGKACFLLTSVSEETGDILSVSLVLTKTVITQKAIQLKEAVHLHGSSQKKKESWLIK